MTTTGWRIPTGPSDAPPPDSRIVEERQRRPLGVSGLLLWLAVGGVAASWLLSRVWPDAPPWDGRVWVYISWAALMGAALAPHLGVASLAAGGAGLLVKRWRLALAAGLLGALLLAPAAIQAQRPAPPLGAAPDESLRIMSVNLNAALPDTSRAIAQIEAADPDLVLFQELTPQLQQSLEAALGEKYPHRANLPRTDCFGQGVFSRLPFVDVPKNRPRGGEKAGWNEPQIGVRVMFQDRILEVWNVHLLPPVSAPYVRQQHANAAALREMVVRRTGAVVLAGDFNSPRDAGPVRGLLRAGLRSAQAEAGGGLGNTWPLRFRVAGRSLALPGVELDHVLHSPELESVHAQVGEDFGSDHRAVVATLRWAETRRRPFSQR